MKRLARILLSIAVIASAAPARALGPVEAAAGVEARSQSSPFAGSAAALSQSAGLGTFVANEHARTPLLVTGMLLMPRYAFALGGSQLVLSLRELVALEETRPDNATGRRLAWSDLSARVAAPRLVTEPLTGIAVTPSVHYALPLSLESQFASSRGTLGATVALERRFGSLEVNGSLALAKGLFRYTSKVATAAEALLTDGENRAVMICRAGESFCGSAGMNSELSLRTALSMRYQLSERFGLGATWVLLNDFRYPAAQAVDEYTPKALDSSGERIAKAGRGRADSTWGVLDAEYRLGEHLSLTAELATVGPAKTRDNQSLRFPFFDLLSPAANLTTFGIGVTASL